FAPYFGPPVMVLAWAVFAGGALQLALQVPALARIGMLPRPRLAFTDPGVRRILLLMGPSVLGVSVAQVSLLINTIIASFLGDGRVSWLYYADRLMEFPTALLGVALGTVLLPSLSKYHSASDEGEYSRLPDWGLRLTFMLATPAAVALALLSVPLVATLFHYGQFGEQDLWMTRQALIAYSAGLLGLGACLNAGLLYHKLRRHGIYQPRPGWGAFALKVAAAIAAMGLVLWLAMGPTPWWLAASGAVRAAALTGLVLLGGAAYFASL